MRVFNSPSCKGFMLFSAIFMLFLCVMAGSPAMAKDSLTLAVKGEPDEGYDPTLGWGRYGSPLFQSTLLKRDENLNIVNDLAVKRSLSADGLAWDVTIREDVKFSDGTPLTAEDVAYTYNTAANSGGKVDLVNLDKAEATGKYTVRLKLKKRDTTFINRLISLGIVPKATHGPGYARKPVGSGPYMMVEWNEGQQMIAQANPLLLRGQALLQEARLPVHGRGHLLCRSQGGQGGRGCGPAGPGRADHPRHGPAPGQER